MIPITSKIAIDESEIKEAFIRASGPGGQKVNKVATAVQLRFDVRHSQSLPEHVRERLTELAGRRMNQNGVLVIDARRFRTQERNRQDGLARLITLIQRAAETSKPRRATRPTQASKRRRLASKRYLGERKQLRRPVDASGE